MSDWKKLAKLSWADRRLLARAAAMLAHTKLVLPSIDLWTEGSAGSARPHADASEATLARARAIARLVDIASARVPFRVACLPRSIVLWRILRGEGIACELRLGARASDGPFEAHAWVECGGVALNESEPTACALPPVRRGGGAGGSPAGVAARRAARAVIAGIVSTHRHETAERAIRTLSGADPAKSDAWRNDGEPSVWFSGALSASGRGPRAFRPSASPVVAFEGALYDAAEARSFAGSAAPHGDASPADLIAALWQAAGPAVLGRLVADFSLAVWDHRDALARPRRRSDGPRAALLRGIRGSHDAGVRVAHPRAARTDWVATGEPIAQGATSKGWLARR